MSEETAEDPVSEARGETEKVPSQKLGGETETLCCSAREAGSGSGGRKSPCHSSHSQGPGADPWVQGSHAAGFEAAGAIQNRAVTSLGCRVDLQGRKGGPCPGVCGTHFSG